MPTPQDQYLHRADLYNEISAQYGDMSSERAAEIVLELIPSAGTDTEGNRNLLRHCIRLASSHEGFSSDRAFRELSAVLEQTRIEVPAHPALLEAWNNGDPHLLTM